MRNPSPIVILALLAGCSTNNKDRTEIVDTTLPNSAQAIVTDMNATDAMTDNMTAIDNDAMMDGAEAVAANLEAAADAASEYGTPRYTDPVTDADEAPASTARDGEVDMTANMETPG